MDNLTGWLILIVLGAVFIAPVIFGAKALRSTSKALDAGAQYLDSLENEEEAHITIHITTEDERKPPPSRQERQTAKLEPLANDKHIVLRVAPEK